ncbi:MAG TPA: efflux RND transporter periplasmic adaptor subunit [Minicystis sp.]|nr:efflux RND transporter periplasmic adaptor subunit [Minicystis sp.]
MKKALVLIVSLAAALFVALALRVHALRSVHRAPGGTGVVEGVDVDVTSRLATRIVKVLVREGDEVEEGQPLVELDCADQDAALARARAELAASAAAVEALHEGVTGASRNASAALESASAARAQIEALEAEQRLAETDLERTRRLFATGALPRAELDAASARDTALRARIAAQRAATVASRDQAGAVGSVRRATEAQALEARHRVRAAEGTVKLAEDAVRECTLVAPRGGTIATRVREPNEAVLPGTTVLTIADVREARTRFYVANADLAAAAPGRAVRVVADAYPGQAFEGTIFYVSPRAEFTPRNVQTREDRDRLVYAVEVRIPNPERRLREGMPVEVVIEPPRPPARAVGMP